MGNLHLHCDREHLLAAIQAADAVVPANSTKPILQNILLDAKATELEVIATDQQVGLRAVIRKVEIRTPGQAVVNARQMAAIIKESSSRTVTITIVQHAEASQLHIELADGDYDIPNVVGESFPPVSFFPSDVVPIPVKGERFDQALRQTVFAMDKDRTSAVLSGLCLTISEGRLIVAATDGKVLAEHIDKDVAFQLNAGTAPIVAVLPAVAVNHLQRIVSSAKPTVVELAFAGKLLFARLALDSGLMVELTSRLVEGTFPNYAGALTAQGHGLVVFSASELASAVRRAALMTNQTSRGIVMTLDAGKAVFSNLNYTNGSVRIPVACDYSGPTLKLGLNAQYIQDVLKVWSSERITVELSRGLVMREPNVTYLIMPISLPS